MKKKSVVFLLSLLSAFGFAFAASACGDASVDVGGNEVTVSGFDVAESIEVNVGAVIDLEQPIVTDSKGVLLDCWTYVTDGSGNYVAVTAGSFTADNVGEYTIVYVVRDSANNTYEKQTKVTVLGEGNVGEEITLTANFEQFVVVGEEVTIDAVCSAQDATIAYEVKRFSSGEELEVLDGKFTPQEAGLYEVLLSANGGVATYKYNVFAEAPLQEGEVESFGEAWEEKETFVGGKRQDWEIVSSADCGITDPYGRETVLAKYTTTRQYIPLYINIRENVEYYEQLAEEGYTVVSMWIYMESEKPHITISDRDPNGGFYRRNGPDLHPGVWTEFRLDLITGKTTWYRSFVQCYEYYDNQTHFYLQVDNSNDWNISSENEFWGNEPEITFYFTDIYAVKDVEIATADDVEGVKALKDTVDLSTVFSADFDMEYFVTCRREKVALDGSEYTFMANGEYVVEAIPKAFNLRASKTFTFQVTDEHTLTANPLIKERADESVRVQLSELNAAFTEVNGVTPTVEEYRVFLGDEEIPVEDGAFVAEKDGAYTVQVKGVYLDDGVQCATYHSVLVDVWSAATKYTVIDVNYIRNIRAWDWDKASTTAAVENATVGGETGDFVKLTAKGQSLTFYAKPMFSKAYYEALLAENANTTVRMALYFQPAASAADGKTTNVKSVVTSTTDKTTWGAEHENAWLNFEMPMASFIAQYDEIFDGYERLAEASWGDDTNGGKGCWLHMLGSEIGRTVYLDLSAGIIADTVSVALKDGAAFALKQDNDLTQLLDVTLDGVVGKILSAEVLFNGEWVALDDLTFAPVWAGEYTFRFKLEREGGVYYKTIEQAFNVGDEAFVATVDTALYTLEKGEDFDVLKLLDRDYAFEVEAFNVTRGKKEAATITDGLTLKSELMQEGVYLVNVYAIDGEGALSKILYYTFTIQYLGEYGKTGIWLEAFTAETYETVFQSYQYANKQNLTDTTVTTEIPAGNEGTFLKYEGREGNNKEAMSFAFKPLYTEAFYRSVMSGERTYSVRFDVWLENVNADCTRTNAYCYSWDAAGTSFTTRGLSLALGQWHTVEIPLDILVNNLVDGEVKFFGVYIPYGGYNNTDWMRMYIGNICVVMDEIEAETAEVTTLDGKQLALNESNDLTQILGATLDGEAAEITAAEVSFNGEWVTLDDLTFKPVWAGEYTFRITAKDGVARKYKTVEVTYMIGDEAFTPTVDTDLHAVELGSAFDASTLLAEDYTYSLQLIRSVGGVETLIAEVDGVLVQTTGLSVGAYTVKVYAVAAGDAFGKILYYTFTLDVWSQELQYAVLDTENMRAIRAWDWDNASTVATVEEATLGGKTGNFVKTTARGQSLVLYAKPLYSKAYYEAMLAENADMKVCISIYFIPATTGKDTNFRSFYHPTKVEWFDLYNEQWNTYETSLASFIEVYEEVNGKYEEFKSASYGADTNGYEGTWMQLIGSQIGRTAYVSVTLRYEATESTATLAEGKQFALNESNDLTGLLTVTLDGVAAEVTAADVCFNGEWVTLEDLTFTPAWAGEYTFRLDVETANGLLYATGVEVTLQIGEGTFETIEDTEVWTLQADETLYLESLPDTYEYEVEIYNATRGAMTLVCTQADTFIVGADFSEGVYFVKIYAIADGEFGKILYRTLTINALGAYGAAGVWLEEFTAETYRDLFKSYQYSANQNLTDTTVTESVPTGNSGAFLKYEGREGNNKEAMSFAFKPLYTKEFYGLLVDNPRQYTVKFDVWLENVNADCTRTSAYCYSWNTAGTSFTTQGLSLALGQWHTVEIPLGILVNNLVDGEVKFFGVYIPYGGYKTSDWMRVYIGNIRLEEAPMMWSAATLTTDMLTTYQYTSSQNLAFTSLTTEIPEGGVVGTYVKWAQTSSKEDVQLAIAPVYEKEYYEELLASGINYKITYDVYVTVTTDGFTGTSLSTKLWKTKDDGTHTFATYGTIGLNAWHTVEIDLNYLVANWSNYRLFGLNFTGGGYDRNTERVTFYLGNIQLVEGTASGVATLKA